LGGFVVFFFFFFFFWLLQNHLKMMSFICNLGLVAVMLLLLDNTIAIKLQSFFPLSANAKTDCGATTCPATPAMSLAVSGNSSIDTGVFGATMMRADAPLRFAFAGSQFNRSAGTTVRRCFISPRGEFTDPGDEFSVTAWLKFDSKLPNFTATTVCGGTARYYSLLPTGTSS
jgi:hypothetical protein